MRANSNLKGLYEAAVRDRAEDRFYDDLRESLEKKEVSWRDFSIRQLFEDFVDDGASLISNWFHNPGDPVRITESGVSSTTFLNISGQLLVNRVMEAYNGPEFISDQLVETISTKLPRGEKIPGMSQIGNEAEAVGEGKPYPLVGFGEDWIETPETVKRGMICPITREAVVGDLTGLIMQRAGDVGEWIRYNKEVRCLQAALGITSLYNRRSRGVVQSYDDNNGNHDFDNLAATNALVDWTDIENALLLFDSMVDPSTGTPIRVLGGTLQIVVPTALLFTARRVINSTLIRFGDGAANTTQTEGPNPVSGIEIVSSQLVKSVTSSATTWFLGRFKKAFAYMEISPIQVTQAPANNEAEFTQDIVARFKVSEWGAAACLDPRYVVKSTA